MISEEEKKNYLENGFLLLKDFFNFDSIEKILKDAKQVFLLQFIKRGYTQQQNSDSIPEAEFNSMMYRLFNDDFQALSNCGKQVQHLISLHKLSLEEKIISLLHSIGFKFPNISTRPVMFFNHSKLSKEKVFYKVDPHQDWRSMQGSLNSVVIWVPLIDINSDLGALEILPGSHKLGLITDKIHHGFGMVRLNDDQNKSLLTVEVKKGDALLFSSFLVHQSGNNITDSPRWSAHFRYNDLAEPSFIERSFAHPYIYKPMEDLITPDFPKPELIDKIFSNG
jgi:ectoine hydroxylase-related dioxygenase (phytanoyl-CoA dioxygenase family)